MTPSYASDAYDVTDSSREFDWFGIISPHVMRDGCPLSPSARLVYCAMTLYAGKDRKNVRPSIARLVGHTGLSKSAVVEARKELVHYGVALVTKEGVAAKKGERIRNTSAEYRLIDTDAQADQLWSEDDEWIGGVVRGADNGLSVEPTRVVQDADKGLSVGRTGVVREAVRTSTRDQDQAIRTSDQDQSVAVAPSHRARASRFGRGVPPVQDEPTPAPPGPAQANRPAALAQTPREVRVMVEPDSTSDRLARAALAHYAEQIERANAADGKSRWKPGRSLLPLLAEHAARQTVTDLRDALDYAVHGDGTEHGPPLARTASLAGLTGWMHRHMADKDSYDHLEPDGAEFWLDVELRKAGRMPTYDEAPSSIPYLMRERAQS